MSANEDKDLTASLQLLSNYDSLFSRGKFKSEVALIVKEVRRIKKLHSPLLLLVALKNRLNQFQNIQGDKKLVKIIQELNLTLENYQESINDRFPYAPNFVQPLEDSGGSSSTHATQNVGINRSNTMFLEYSNKKDMLTKLGLMMLEGNFQYQMNLVAILRAYPEEMQNTLEHFILKSTQQMKQGCMHANVFMAILYQYGLYQPGIIQKPELQLARQYYQQALELGHPTAIVNQAYIHRHQKGRHKPCSNCYLVDLGVALGVNQALFLKVNEHYKGSLKAIKLTNRAIESGCANAMMRQVNAYLSDLERVGYTDLKAIHRLSNTAISQGNTEAMCLKAYCYEQGLGCQKNSIKAFQLVQRASEWGDPEAMYLYASYLEHGVDLGIAPAPEQAIKLYRRSANLGCTRAKEKYKDIQKAKLLSIASKQAHAQEITLDELNNIDKMMKELIGRQFHLCGGNKSALVIQFKCQGRVSYNETVTELEKYPLFHCYQTNRDQSDYLITLENITYDSLQELVRHQWELTPIDVTHTTLGESSSPISIGDMPRQISFFSSSSTFNQSRVPFEDSLKLTL